MKKENVVRKFFMAMSVLESDLRKNDLVLKIMKAEEVSSDGKTETEKIGVLILEDEHLDIEANYAVGIADNLFDAVVCAFDDLVMKDWYCDLQDKKRREDMNELFSVMKQAKNEIKKEEAD